MIYKVGLLFNRVDNINEKQEKMEAKMDMSNKVLEQMIKDQDKLSKQIAETGHGVAQLRMKERWKNHLVLHFLSSRMRIPSMREECLQRMGLGTRRAILYHPRAQ
jgi:chromosome segregation ATPase